MDKVMPKSSDVFQANRDRAAPLLKQLRADGIGHMIDGKIVASISGETFETNSPVDGAVLASVARGNAEDIDRAATAAAPTISPCSNASTPARPIASWPGPRSGLPRTSVSSPTNAPTPAMA